MKANIKILKATIIERPGKNFKGLEVEFEVDNVFKRECFCDADEVLKEVKGEKVFITRIKELHNKTSAEQASIETAHQAKKDIKTELYEFKDKVVK